MAVAVEKPTRSFGAARPEGASDRLCNEDLAPTNERLWACSRWCTRRQPAGARTRHHRHRLVRHPDLVWRACHCRCWRSRSGRAWSPCGTLLGLPVNWAIFSLITLIVTAGAVAVFGEAIRDPVEIVARIDNTF